MGLLTEFMRESSQKQAQEKQTQLEAYRSILTAPDAKPEAKQYAIDQMMKTSGMKGPGKDLFTNLLGGLIHRGKNGKSAAPSGPPSMEGPGVPGGITGFGTQQGETPDGLPVTKPKPEYSAGEAPSKGMFYSPGEQQDMSRQAQQQELGIVRQKQETLDAQKLQFEKQQLQQKEQILQAAKKAQFDQTIKLLPTLPVPEERKQEIAMQAWRQMNELPPEPRTPAAEMKPHVIRKADGSEVTVFEMAPGKYHTPDGKAVELTAQDRVDPKEEKPELLSQEVRDLKAYYKTQGMDEPAAEKMALQERKKQVDTADKGSEARAIKALADAVADQKKPPTGTYTPGGKSVANPTGDQEIDVGAWEYINSGHLPFTGFSGGGRGKTNPRELMLARAGELIADMGLSPQDLPAVRGSLKANTAALSKVTSMGALITQFESTLEKNMKVAADLSEKFKRGDVRMYNRVLSVFKTGKGDPEALNLAAQLHGVAREWGKIMQGSVSASGVQVSEANASDAFFGQGMSNGQLNSFFQNVIMPDIKNRSEAIQDEKDKLISGLRTTVKDVQGGGPKHFSEGSDHWDIPADKVEAFKKAHPNAKAQ